MAGRIGMLGRVVGTVLLIGFGAAAEGGAQAWAQVGDGNLPGGPAAPQSPVPGGEESKPTGEPGFETNLWARSNLLGDMFGLRTWLERYGITVGVSEASEVFGNATGGVHTGADYNGLTLLSAGLDTQKAFGWRGGTVNVSAFQIHGRSVSSDNLDDLQTASGIEAERATRLWELWYQQSFLDGQLDVKLGQQSLDQEFMGSTYSGLFINTMMGWPALPSYDLYAGGPAYPLSSLGVRLRGAVGPVTLLGGVFDDNPPGGSFADDDQLRGAAQSGVAFSTDTGVLVIAEIQYALNQPSTGNMVRPGDKPSGLAGVYKLGGWYDTGKFPDQRFDDLGLSLADPASDGVARNRRHNFSLYAVVDQLVWQPDPKAARAVGVFMRVMGAPADRNLVSFSLNTGITLKAPFAGRDSDTVGLGYGLTKVSPRAASLDTDLNQFTGTLMPVRGSESFIELTYQYTVAPWWTVQPDLQYVFMPGGGVQDPADPSQRVGNELTLGMRTSVTF